MRKAMQGPKLQTSNASSSSVTTSTSLSTRDTNENLELHGNPIYSPENSLAAAASKLAQIKATPARSSSTAACTARDAMSRATPATKQSNEMKNLVNGIDCKTPACEPPQDAQNKKGGRDEIPLAARSLISKRNRRKSIFQRPARYGEWFDGDDEELERMVESDSNDENQENLVANKKAGRNIRKIEKDHGDGRAQVPSKAVEEPSAPNEASPPATDVVKKVRAITEGLCDKLDGLIEETPLGKMGHPKDDRTLRDKLLESWEGRSYYDRLMELAGEDQKQRQDIERAREVAKEEARKRQSLQNEQSSQAQSSGQREQYHHAQSLHGILSPPKAKLKKEISAALAKASNLDTQMKIEPNVGLPPTSKSKVARRNLNEMLPSQTMAKEDAHAISKQSALPITNAHKTSPLNSQKKVDETSSHGHSMKSSVNSRPSISVGGLDPSKLLKVSSGRGPKPFAAPWQNTSSESIQKESPELKEDSVKYPEQTEKETKTIANRELELELERECERMRKEIESLQKALRAAQGCQQELEYEKDMQRKEIDELKEKLQEAEETAVAEAEAHRATEKRMASLEAEVASLKSAADNSDNIAATTKSLKS